MLNNNNNNKQVLAISPAAGGKRKGSAKSYLLGSSISGLLEIGIFHPVDTITKRLISNTATSKSLNDVIFQKAANDPSKLNKLKSLWPGMKFAAGYKVLQRTYKFGGQPFVVAQIESKIGGSRAKKTWISALAGSLIGIGEIALLPLDVLKIKSQINPGILAKRGAASILREEGFRGMYRGAGWTAARNAPGSFALFGASSFTHNQLLRRPEGEKKTFGDIVIASTVGSITCLFVSSPLDVIKTRIQNKAGPGVVHEGGFNIIRNTLKNEGIGAFFKGMTPKLMVIAPKLIFSFTVATSLIQFFQDMEKPVADLGTPTPPTPSVVPTTPTVVRSTIAPVPVKEEEVVLSKTDLSKHIIKRLSLVTGDAKVVSN